MEYDRFEHHPVVYLLGMLFLILGLFMLGFAVYLLPHMLFSWVYSIPMEWYQWSQKLQMNYALAPEKAERWLFLAFVILGLIAIYLAEWIANYLDAHELRIRRMLQVEEKKEPEVINEKKDGWRLFLLVALILMITILGVNFLEWSIQLTSVTNEKEYE